jgi:hypothetical protein
MRRLVAQVQAVFASAGLTATRGRALSRRELAHERGLQRAQRRRLAPAVARVAPHRGDIPAHPQIRIAQLRGEHEPPQARTVARTRAPGGNPPPERPLADAHLGGRRADLAGRQLPPRTAGGQLADKSIQGRLAQRPLVAWIVACPAHTIGLVRDATPPPPNRQGPATLKPL